MLYLSPDWIAFVASGLGLGMLVAMGEGLRGWGVSPTNTRRFVHCGVGLFVAGTPLLFSSPCPVLLLAVVFVGVNLVAKWRRWWESLHAARPESWGTVLMPVALIVALAATWFVSADRVFALQLAFGLLAVADPLAAFIGERWGTRELVPDATLVGSLVFLGTSSFVSGLFLVFLTTWPIFEIVAITVLVAVSATLVEMICRRGTDNLFVVLAVLLVMVSLHEGSATIGGLVAALGIGAVFGGVAYGLNTLDGPASIGGGLFAMSLVGFGGTAWIVPGVAFFAFSSALSFAPLASESVGGNVKESRKRSLRQVLANGGIAWGSLVVFALVPDGGPEVRSLCYAGFLGALAAAAADTWATEIGIRYGKTPWSVRTRSRVPQGTSGAISLIGTVAALIGAGTVVCAAMMVGGEPGGTGLEGSQVLLAGMVGMGVDSLSGATIQAHYSSSQSGEIGENASRSEMGPTRGYIGVDNEVVNTLCTGSGALVSIALSGMM